MLNGVGAGLAGRLCWSELAVVMKVICSYGKSEMNGLQRALCRDGNLTGLYLPVAGDVILLTVLYSSMALGVILFALHSENKNARGAIPVGV